MCGKYICEEIVVSDKGLVASEGLVFGLRSLGLGLRVIGAWVLGVFSRIQSLIGKMFGLTGKLLSLLCESFFFKKALSLRNRLASSLVYKYVSGSIGFVTSSFASMLSGGGLLCLFSFALLFAGIFFFFSILAYPQQYTPPSYLQQQPPQYGSSYRPAAFRQEVAKIEAIVERAGKQPLSLTQVPRVQSGDVIKIRLSDEAVGGIKPDQSMYDWSMSIAYVNPNRNKDDQSSVSREIRFRRDGWYKQHSFEVPYDSQPIIFLYPKPGYRSKVLKLIGKKYEDVKKLGEKTIDIAGAYAQVGMFLNELQGVLNGYSGGYGGYGSSSSYGSSGYGSYGGSFNTYNPYGGYGTYGGIGNNRFNINYNFIMQQSVERLARSFNIQLPDCWRGVGSGFTSYGNSNSFGYGLSSDMVSKVQCVAKQVRLEDLDVSISRMLQQGGIFAVAQLQQKYPQIAYWINIAALALDFILKVTRKTPLRIVPTIASSPDLMNGNSQYGGQYGGQGGAYGGASSYQSSYQPGYQQPYQSQPGGYGPGGVGGSSIQPLNIPKISIMAESQPNDNDFVTAYPVVLHKWQSDADPDVISLRTPVLAEPCLHAGLNVLKNTDLSDDASADNFTKDFMLQLTSPNGFKKEFPLRKNLGLGGWELNLTKEDLNSFPKIQMDIDAVVSGTRGFNEIKSPAFKLPIGIESQWEVTRETQKSFAVGGRRRVTLRNNMGNCRCLQAVIYKPSFGGQFVFEANGNSNGNNTNNNELEFSVDGKEVSFEVDASSFQPGQGTLELRTYGGEAANLNIKLYPLPPNITDIKVARGDSFAKISGERLEQLDYIIINGKKANVVGKMPNQNTGYGTQNTGGYGSSQYQNQQYGQPNQYQQPQYQQQPQQYPNQQSYPQQNQYPNQNLGQYPQAQTYPQQQPNQSPNQGGYVDTGAGAYGNQQNPSYQNQSPVTSYQSLNTLSPNEKIVVFEEPDARVLSNQITIELGLEDDRRVPFEKTFPVAPSRPAIVANPQKEIEASVVDNGQLIIDSEKQGVQSPRPKAGPATNKEARTNNASPLSTVNSQLSIKDALPVETNQLTLSVQNSLTDYDFKVENLSIETRVENSQGYIGETPRVNFEVLDWRNIRIDLSLSEAVQKTLGGRRLQFRIRDLERGDSDWYTIKQTFIRQATIKSIRCTNEMNGMCEMKGEGIDYIQQVSVDNGQTWYPQEPQTFQAQPTPDGQKMVLIPMIRGKKLLKIRLRDYPKEVITQSSFSLVNTVRMQKNTNQAGSPNQQVGAQGFPPPQTYPQAVPQNDPAQPANSTGQNRNEQSVKRKTKFKKKR